MPVSIPSATARLLSRFLVMGLAFFAAGIPARAQQSDSLQWRMPTRCIFGMPHVRKVVQPDERGALTLVLKEVFNLPEVHFEHHNLPYPRALDGLHKGAIHCTLALQGYHAEADEAEVAIAIYDLAVVYRVKDGFKGVEEMKGGTVACLYGFDLQNLLDVPVVVRTAYDLTSSLRLLDQGHVKYVLDEQNLLREALLETKLPTSEFGIVRLRSLEVHPVFAPTEKGKLFRAIFDERMKDMAESGKLRKIFSANGISEDKIKRLFEANGY